MKEIGGYIELDNYSLPMMHEEGLKLNCGRNCLRYLIRAKNIKKIALPYFFCDSVINVCLEEKIEVIYYNINEYFYPHEIVIDDETWLYLVNFYGQLSIEYIKELSKIYSNKLIIDNAQAYFELPVKNVDTIYTCRKFFGVPDGGILFTNCF